MTDTTTITVTVEIGGREYVRQVEGTHWARDDNDRLYVYDDERTVLDVANENAVEVLREDAVQTIAAFDATTTADTATTEEDSCQ